ncbi:unnamed protein product, partial [marine sediment metagenome]
LISNLEPKGSLAAGTTKTYINLTTDEPAYCRYSKEAGQSYDSMRSRFSYDKDKLFHKAFISGLEDNKAYRFYVRCRDIAGNKNDEDTIMQFGIGGASVPSGNGGPTGDNTPPYRYNESPEGELPVETRQATLSLETDESASCRYDTYSGVGYESMSHNFNQTGGTLHSTLVTGFSEGQEYEYFVKCIDSENNKNSNDLVISFEVVSPEDNTPPKISNAYPFNEEFSAGTEETIIGLS